MRKDGPDLDADSEDETLQLSGDDSSAGAGVLPNGSLIGRYVVLGTLGKGGMGVVYLAYDPELDRRIALKILRSVATRDVEARERLLAEAKALAKLSHPNVVSAFDAGSWEQSIYIAMELVEGKTLAEWLKAQPRKQREVLDVMLAAGRGLEAAHRAGIVHRDIKPQNIIVGSDGRVRVIDFGIAWRTREVAPPEERSADGKPVYAIAGSPGYMPPEQCRGEPVDGTADQFAFCSTLYLAIYGVPAFSPESWSQLQSQMAERRYNKPAERVRVGAWLERIIERGLSPNKVDRFPSMTELLLALAADPWRRWKRVAVGGGVVASVAVGMALALAWSERQQRVCLGASDKLVGVWDAGRRSAVEKAFTATGRPHAPATFSRVAASLDRLMGEWVAMRTDACEATRRRGEQSEELLDLRMHCLDRVLDETRATVNVFATLADAELVDDAVRVVGRLPGVQRCANTTVLKAAYPLPTDPDKVLRLEALRRRIGEARALERAGKYALGLPLAKEVLAVAQQEGYPPLEAQALGVLATLQGASGELKAVEETLRLTLKKAAEARDDALLAETAIFELYVTGQAEERSKEAFAMEPLVDALVARLPDDKALDARRLTALGLMRQRLGKYPEAQRYFEQALALLQKITPTVDMEVAEALNNLASVTDDQAHSAEALKFYEQALALQEKSLGADHPRVASVLNNIGLALLSLNEPVKAEAALRRALTIWIATFGAEHPEVARTYNNLGLVLAESGKLHEARLAYDRSLAIKEKRLGSNHPSVAAVLEGLGTLANQEGRFNEGLALCSRAQAIVEKAYGGEHPNLAYYLTCKGVAAIGLQKKSEAVSWLEQAMKLRAKNPAGPADMATTRLALARALRLAGQSATRCKELATQALVELRGAGGRADKIVEVEHFLAELEARGK